MATLAELKATRAQIAAEREQMMAQVNLNTGRMVAYDEFIAAEEAILAKAASEPGDAGKAWDNVPAVTSRRKR